MAKRKREDMKVFKYQCEVTDKFRMELPEHAQILTVHMQKGFVCIWALVDPDAQMEFRWFRMVGTGHPIDVLESGSFVGTVFMGAELVFHLFEIKAESKLEEKP